MEGIERVLLDCERDVHRGGWDQPPFLAVLEGKGILPGLRLTSMNFRMHSDPVNVLMTLAHIHETDPAVNLHFVRDYPRFAGLAFVTEGWMPPADMSTEETRALKRRRQKYADTPGGREARSIVAITLDAETIMVNRVRGEKAACFTDEVLTGRVTQALCRIMVCVMQEMPEWTEELEKMEALLALVRRLDAEEKAATANGGAPATS